MKRLYSYLFIILFMISFAIAGIFYIKYLNKENKVVENVSVMNKKNEIVMLNNKIVESRDEVKVYKVDFLNVTETYFDDALFIGDSRTVGIRDYSGINSTFFANTGMSVYNVLTESIDLNGKNINLEELLKQSKFSKIYIMLGINELGYNLENNINNYKRVVEFIQSYQENAIIYIEANLHVSEEKSNSNKIFNNKNIDRFNDEIFKIADNKKIFYIDVNSIFDDESGNLNSDYTWDGVHIYAKYYKEWKKYLLKYGVLLK